MYAVFLETETHQYLITSGSETGLIHSLAEDIESGVCCDEETFKVLQLHAGYNNVFDEQLEGKLLKMIQTLKIEKENTCKL